jgi:hypothetical protein
MFMCNLAIKISGSKLESGCLKAKARCIPLLRLFDFSGLSASFHFLRGNESHQAVDVRVLDFIVL